MRKTSVRELHIHTSELVREAAEGGVIVIERRGEPVAELRPHHCFFQYAGRQESFDFRRHARNLGIACHRSATVRRFSKKIAIGKPRVSGHLIYRQILLQRTRFSCVFASLSELPMSSIPHCGLRRVPRGTFIAGYAKGLYRRETHANFPRIFTSTCRKACGSSSRFTKLCCGEPHALMVSAPPELFIRTADAVHLVTAYEPGNSEVWTNDRHMLASASYFGLVGRSV